MAAGAVVNRTTGDPAGGLVKPGPMADHLRPARGGHGSALQGAGPASCSRARPHGQRLHRYLPT
ncbi:MULTISPECIES: hypothetical protein [Xanthomonas]|uniref:hypothetical protein n=1 Tax=unclassified Xanthomonas TaxID=2643310 RepID=UPI000E5A73F4|nr:MULTISPECIES: hypothetical protein [Xanthomonas]